MYHTLFRLSLQVITTCAYLIATLSSTFPSSPACQTLLIWSCKPYIDENIPKSTQFSYTRIQIHWIHMPTHTFGANWERHPIYPSLLHAPPRLPMAPPCATPHPDSQYRPLSICLPEPTASYFNPTNTCTSLLTNRNRLMRPAPRMQTAKPNQSNPKYTASHVVIKCEEWRR